MLNLENIIIKFYQENESDEDELNDIKVITTNNIYDENKFTFFEMLIFCICYSGKKLDIDQYIYIELNNKMYYYIYYLLS